MAFPEYPEATRRIVLQNERQVLRHEHDRATIAQRVLYPSLGAEIHGHDQRRQGGEAQKRRLGQASPATPEQRAKADAHSIVWHDTKVSEPPPPAQESVPGPPSSASFPVPPSRVSLPSSPNAESLPSPQIKRS